MSDKGGAIELVVIGDVKDPKWTSGEKLSVAEGAGVGYIHHYELTSRPADLSVDVGGKTVSLTVPLIENGEANPFLAAFMGLPVNARPAKALPRKWTSTRVEISKNGCAIV